MQRSEVETRPGLTSISHVNIGGGVGRGSKSSLLLTSVSLPCGLPIVLGKGLGWGDVEVTAGLRSCGFSQLETSHGGWGGVSLWLLKVG